MNHNLGQPPEDDMAKMAGDLPALYREIADEAPSAAHDDAILAAARAELRQSAKSSRQPWLLRWKLPLAFAATVMLTTTLTLTVEREQSRQHEMEIPLPQAVPVAPASVATPTEARPAAADSTIGKQEPAAPAAAARQRSINSEPPAPAKQMNTAPEAKQPLQSFVPEPAPVAPAAGSLNRALPSPVLQQAAPLAAPAPAASTSGASARDAERTNTAPLREQRMVPPAQPAKPAPAPPPPAPAASEDRMAPAAIPSENRGLFIRNNETPAAAGAAAGKPAASSLDAQPLRKEKAASGERREAIDATQAAKPPRSPQDWIAEIRALRQAGREAEAQAALKQLKTAYPDFAIPDDLRDKP